MTQTSHVDMREASDQVVPLGTTAGADVAFPLRSGQFDDRARDNLFEE